MRVTRGLLASLGASGCMAAAGAAVLLALSAVIGVRGWPGLDGGSVTVQGISARAAVSRPAPRQRLGGPAGPTPPAAARPVLAPPQAAPRDPPPRPPAPASSPRAPQLAPTAASPAPTAAGAPGSSSAPAPKGSPAGDAVRGAGDGAGSVAAPVSPAAAQT